MKKNFQAPNKSSGNNKSTDCNKTSCGDHKSSDSNNEAPCTNHSQKVINSNNYFNKLLKASIPFRPEVTTTGYDYEKPS